MQPVLIQIYVYLADAAGLRIDVILIFKALVEKLYLVDQAFVLVVQRA